MGILPLFQQIYWQKVSGDEKAAATLSLLTFCLGRLVVLGGSVRGIFEKFREHTWRERKERVFWPIRIKEPWRIESWRVEPIASCRGGILKKHSQCSNRSNVRLLCKPVVFKTTCVPSGQGTVPIVPSGRIHGRVWSSAEILGILLT